jgi:hypothetical protein
MSPAEQTMSRYQGATNPSGAATFPIDPITGFVSSYPAGFAGCMYCGNPAHLFSDCSQRSTPGASIIFFKNLYAHKPHVRKRPPSQPGAGPGTQSFPTSSSQQPADVSTATTETYPSALKCTRFCVIIVKSFAARTVSPGPTLPPMPIAIDNGLPHITVTLGANPATDPTLCGLMDTCGALNTGYLTFHLWLMSERPDLVVEFLSFDDSNPFEPIKLGGAISDPANFDATDHGNLTAVIRYRTPYIDLSGSPIVLSFALGPDVTVNTIFGLPMLSTLDSVISLNSNSLHSRALNTDFPITRAAAAWGLPPNCTFNPASASRQHASTTGLSPCPNASSSAPVTPALATAQDDNSLGFLKRTIHPSS